MWREWGGVPGTGSSPPPFLLIFGAPSHILLMLNRGDRGWSSERKHLHLLCLVWKKCARKSTLKPSVLCLLSLWTTPGTGGAEEVKSGQVCASGLRTPTKRVSQLGPGISDSINPDSVGCKFDEDLNAMRVIFCFQRPGEMERNFWSCPHQFPPPSSATRGLNTPGRKVSTFSADSPFLCVSHTSVCWTPLCQLLSPWLTCYQYTHYLLLININKHFLSSKP